MAEVSSPIVTIERIELYTIVSLKVVRDSLDNARERLALASPGRVSPGNPESLWLGPDHWLIVSSSLAAQNIVEECSDALTDILHSAVDYSAGLAVLRVMGPGARQSLASGTGIDLRPRQFPEGTCWRTRLAQIPAVIVANSEDYFNVFVDRTYGSYMEDWLEESSGILSAGTT